MGALGTSLQHGELLAGDVTVPSDPDFGEIISVGYGFMPYLLGLLCLVELVPALTPRPLAATPSRCL